VANSHRNLPPVARCRVLLTDAHTKIISPPFWVVSRNSCARLGDFAGRIARFLGGTYLRRSSLLPRRDRLVTDFLATNRRQCPFLHRFDRGKRAEMCAFRFLPSESLSARIQVTEIFLRETLPIALFSTCQKERLTGIRSRTDPELDSVREGTRDRRRRSTREGAFVGPNRGSDSTLPRPPIERFSPGFGRAPAFPPPARTYVRPHRA
jgi:hypothetical protein